MKRTLSILAAVLFLGATTLAVADDAASTSAASNTGTAQKGLPVGKRFKNQAKRIRQGLKSGKLTKEQAEQLKADEKAMREKVKEERAANGGKLTKDERKEMQNELNQESQKIKSMEQGNAASQSGTAK